MTKQEVTLFYCANCGAEADPHFTGQPCACCAHSIFFSEVLRCSCLVIERNWMHQEDIVIGDSYCQVHGWM